MVNPDLETKSSQEARQITPEYLKELSTLEVEAKGNFGEVLSRFNVDKGLNLQSRPEGFHITVIGPAESKILSTLTQEQIDALQRINDDIQQGIGTESQGLGFIDGAQRDDIRKADKEKKVLYVAFNIPALQEFRKSLGLAPKDLHATLGFAGGDIHMHKTGVDAKGKDTIEPISKKADANYQQYAEQLQGISFGSLSGKENEKPKN